MNYLQLIHGTDESENVNETSRKSITVHAARFLQINDRLSTVLLASNEEETLQRDPALNICKAFGDVKRISVVPHLLIARISDFPQDLAHLAYKNQSELVVIPFQGNTLKKQEMQQTSISTWLHSDTYRPRIPEDTIVSHINYITDQLIRKCRVKVAVFVDLTGACSTPRSIKILVPFFGGPDDIESILIALRIGKFRNASVHILHIVSSEHAIYKDDAKMLEYVQRLENDDKVQSRVIYEKLVCGESGSPLKHILMKLEKDDYSLVIVGHFGPYWNAIMQDQEEIEDQNGGTVWSFSRIQDTVNSISSISGERGKDMLRTSSRSASVVTIENVLGVTGAEIYNNYHGSASLLVMRKFRIDKSLIAEK